MNRLALVARCTQSPTLRVPLTRCMSGYSSDWRPLKEIDVEDKCTMDYHPVPQGSWQDYHSKRNNRWSMQLAVAASVFAGTIFVMKKTGVFYLHPCPPLKK